MNLNPLELPELLERIFSYLDSTSDLLNCLKINRRWYIAVLEQFLSRQQSIVITLTNANIEQHASLLAQINNDGRFDAILKYELDLSHCNPNICTSIRKLIACLPSSNRCIKTLRFTASNNWFIYNYNESNIEILKLIDHHLYGLNELVLVGRFISRVPGVADDEFQNYWAWIDEDHVDNDNDNRVKNFFVLNAKNELLHSLKSLDLNMLECQGSGILGMSGIRKFINNLAPRLQKLRLTTEAECQSLAYEPHFHGVSAFLTLTHLTMTITKPMLVTGALANLQTPAITHLKLILQNLPNSSTAPTYKRWLLSNSRTLTSLVFQFPRLFPHHNNLANCLPLLPNVSHFGYCCTDPEYPLSSNEEFDSCESYAGINPTDVISWTGVADKFPNLRSVSTHLGIYTYFHIPNNNMKPGGNTFDWDKHPFWQQIQFKTVETLTLESKELSYHVFGRPNYKEFPEHEQSYDWCDGWKDNILEPERRRLTFEQLQLQQEADPPNLFKHVKMMSLLYPCVHKLVLIQSCPFDSEEGEAEEKTDSSYGSQILAAILAFFEHLEELQVINYDQDYFKQIFKSASAGLKNLKFARIRSLQLHSECKRRINVSHGFGQFGIDLDLLLRQFPSLESLTLSEQLAMAEFRKYKICQSFQESASVASHSGFLSVLRSCISMFGLSPSKQFFNTKEE